MSLAGIWPMVLVLLAAADRSACAYTGGPVRAEIAGYAPADRRIYFRLVACDESGTPPRAYYFDLEGSDPTRPIRARSLENADTLHGDRSPLAWRALRRRLVPLGSEERFALATEVRAESTGVDRRHEAPIFRLEADLSSGELHARLVLIAYCTPTVGVKGLLRVPQRRERLVILTVTGRPYGCEDVETPVLLD